MRVRVLPHQSPGQPTRSDTRMLGRRPAHSGCARRGASMNEIRAHEEADRRLAADPMARFGVCGRLCIVEFADGIPVDPERHAVRTLVASNDIGTDRGFRNFTNSFAVRGCIKSVATARCARLFSTQGGTFTSRKLFPRRARGYRCHANVPAACQPHREYAIRRMANALRLSKEGGKGTAARYGCLLHTDLPYNPLYLVEGRFPGRFAPPSGRGRLAKANDREPGSVLSGRRPEGVEAPGWDDY